MTHLTYNLPYMLKHNSSMVEIDIEIFKIVYHLWKQNIHTFESCQGGLIEVEHVYSDLMTTENNNIYSNPWVICHKSGEKFLKENFSIEGIVDGPYGFNISDYFVPENKNHSDDIITCVFKNLSYKKG